MSKILRLAHRDFINPAPTGRLGDGGCDGLAEAGRIAFACYGQRPGRSAERELAAKIRSDFDRAASVWPTFEVWNFVTNAPVGPEATRTLIDLQREHSGDSTRPLAINLLQVEDLWSSVVGNLPIDTLNELFPGAPGAENVELADLLPLLDTLGGTATLIDTAGALLPVPPEKMDYNGLPEASRIEFNAGRRMATRIDTWYDQASNPDLRDVHGEAFRRLYLDVRAATNVPAEILERLYVAVAGSNFRMDGKRANSAFAVLSYFFDSCHIFETPPADARERHPADVAAD